LLNSDIHAALSDRLFLNKPCEKYLISSVPSFQDGYRYSKPSGQPPEASRSGHSVRISPGARMGQKTRLLLHYMFGVPL
jgi:hypothetical protein